MSTLDSNVRKQSEAQIRFIKKVPLGTSLKKDHSLASLKVGRIFNPKKSVFESPTARSKINASPQSNDSRRISPRNHHSFVTPNVDQERKKNFLFQQRNVMANMYVNSPISLSAKKKYLGGSSFMPSTGILSQPSDLRHAAENSSQR